MNTHVNAAIIVDVSSNEKIEKAFGEISTILDPCETIIPKDKHGRSLRYEIYNNIYHHNVIAWGDLDSDRLIDVYDWINNACKSLQIRQAVLQISLYDEMGLAKEHIFKYSSTSNFLITVWGFERSK